MKKHLLIIISGIALSLQSISQPILTGSGVNPVIGDQNTVHNATYVNPGSSGASQTWNLSAMTSQSVSTSTVVAPSSTPYASNFPAATIAVDGGSGAGASFWKANSTKLSLEGIASPSGVIMPYSDPEDFLRFPFTYNDTYTDTWETSFSSGGSTFYRAGSTTFTADSYGTLITPDGTFNNVLRLHLVQNYQDSAYLGFPYIITYQNDEYIWFLNGNHLEAAFVYTLTTSVSSPYTAGAYRSGVISNIQEKESVLSSFEIFPIPSADILNLNIGLAENSKMEIKLFNTTGSEISVPLISNGFTGDNQYQIDVHDLSEGIYFARVYINNEASATRRFIIAK